MSFTYSDGTIYELNYKFVKYSAPNATENNWVGHVFNNQSEKPVVNALWKHDTNTDKYTFHLYGSVSTTPAYDLIIESITYEENDQIDFKSEIEVLRAKLAFYEEKFKAIEILTGLNNKWKEVYSE